MCDWIDSNLLELARLCLENERSFVVRRCVQRFEAGKISAHEAIQRIRRCPLALDGADLTGADLRDATLDGADLAYATLLGADLEGASLIGADLQHTARTSTTFDGATL